MNYKSFLFRGGDETREWVVGIGASIVLHCILLVVIVIFSGNGRYHDRMPDTIDVDLSYIPVPKSKPAKKTSRSVKKTTRNVKKKSTSKKTAIPVKSSKTTKKRKKKVVKPRDIINNAIKELEKDLEKSKPDPISERLRKLEEETVQKEQLTGNVPDEDSVSSSGSGKVEATLLDRYRYNIRLIIEENWAFSENLAGGTKNLETRIVFHIMPDGEIRGIRFTRKSGNSYMDSAASMAIIKSNPVPPHPAGIKKPYVEVRLSFNPKGLE